MPKCKILKDFPFSRDGITFESAKEGTSVDVPEALVKGLKEAGYLEMDQSAPKKAGHENKAIDGAPDNKNAEVGIPEQWKDMDPAAMAELAAKFTDGAINNPDDAIAAIELELERRS